VAPLIQPRALVKPERVVVSRPDCEGDVLTTPLSPTVLDELEQCRAVARRAVDLVDDEVVYLCVPGVV
jgi:hypothetical protein